MFVDASGRRSKKFRRAGWVVAIACACYAVMLGAAVIGGSSSAPWLKIPGLADEKKSDTVENRPAPTPSRSGSHAPGVPVALPTATDSNGVVVPGPSGSAPPGATGTPAPGVSKPGATVKAPTGGAGTAAAAGGAGAAGGTGGTGPVTGAPSVPPVDDPGTAAGSSGGASPPVSPDPSTPPPDPSTSPAAPPPDGTGAQQVAAEGAN
ncbi:hypothetical protein [Streptomyces liangshanensis]|uniref:hypothetical protein n=1 Tax=Streptomyces liangshanensis TaxID=2717324 RepID=UPI001FBAFDC2|nr:hypothetical protein [Streptomyces liangshanensis]